jgi:nucleoside-diphosphate-sugar epimerase
VRAVVTGATGFLGGALARRLRTEGYEVRGLGRNVDAGAMLQQQGIDFLAADINDRMTLQEACRGAHYVFHCAALSSPWGKTSEFYETNVNGTQVALEAAAAARVRRFIHVSSPSIFVDTRDRFDLREDSPPASRAISAYCATKQLAERAVARFGASTLPTVTLRPQGIFGPGDRAIFPRMIRIAQEGHFPMIGNGRNLVDLTYIDNAVDALIACIHAPATTAGHIYHITNGEPVLLYETLARVLRDIGVPYRPLRLPFRLAYLAAGAIEALHRVLLRNREPRLTRYAVCVLARSRTLDISAARRDLGYTPRIAMAEGLRRFAAWWKASHDQA